MTKHWCHWCILSAVEWENFDHEHGDAWAIQLIKDNLEKHLLNNNMIPYDQKGCVLPMLFDSIPIENFIFSLLHAEISIGNKIINSFYGWITKHVEPLLDEEVELSNVTILVNEKNELNTKKDFYVILRKRI